MNRKAELLKQQTDLVKRACQHRSATEAERLVLEAVLEAAASHYITSVPSVRLNLAESILKRKAL